MGNEIFIVLKISVNLEVCIQQNLSGMETQVSYTAKNGQYFLLSEKPGANFF